MLPRKILKIETVKYAFLMFWPMILHIYCKKNRPKINIQSFLSSEENDRRMNLIFNQKNARMFTYFFFG